MVITYPPASPQNPVTAAGPLMTLDANVNIVKALSWQGNLQPAGIQIGANIGLTNLYDRRGRVTCSRATSSSDGSVLTPPAVSIPVRFRVLQVMVHSPRRQWQFIFDVAERLSREQIALVPGRRPIYALRDLCVYSPLLAILDYLTAPTITSTWPPIPSCLPPIVSGQFPLPQTVDDFDRPSDPWEMFSRQGFGCGWQARLRLSRCR